MLKKAFTGKSFKSCLVQASALVALIILGLIFSAAFPVAANVIIGILFIAGCLITATVVLAGIIYYFRNPSEG